jgi:preprotein translocase subunit SecE
LPQRERSSERTVVEGSDEAPWGDMEFLTRIQQFFREVAAEFRRVNWPSRAEVARSTVVVLAVVVILALYLGAVDVGLARIVGVILK